MDLVVVQLDLKRPQPKAAERIEKAITGVRSRYRGLPFLLGTVEYQVYKYLLGHGVQARLFTEELAPEAEEALFEEAQRKAEEIACKVGEERPLLFKGINLFDILLYDITVYIASILRMNHFVRSKAMQQGIIILFTASSLGRSPSPDLPVSDTMKIEQARGRGFVGTMSRLLSRFCRRVADHEFDARRFTYEQHGSASPRRRVLFATIDNETGNCAEPLAFVLKELGQNPDMAAFVAADNTFTRDYLRELNPDSSVFNYSESLQGLIHWLKSSRSFRRKASELANQHGHGSTDAFIISAFCQRFVNLQTLSRVYSRILWLDGIFERCNPAAVVAFPLHSHIARIAVRLGEMRKLPKLTFIPTWTYGLKPGGDTLSFSIYNHVDFVLVPGEDSRSALVMGGVDLKKILLIGNPKLEAIRRMSAEQDRAQVRSLFGARPTDQIFLVASYVLVPGTMKWVRALVRQLKTFSGGFKLIIKPHPDESPSEYERVLQEEKLSNAAVSTGVPLYTLLNASDIVFTGMSTVGSEAVLFDKPLICLNFSDVPYSVRYDEAGVAPLVKTEEQILPTIESVLHDPKVKNALEVARRRFQELYAYRLDGRASERFVTAIRNAIDSSSNFKEISKP